MLDHDFIQSATLLFVLLNPFLMSIYLLDLIREMPAGSLGKVLARAALISGIVFIVFAWTGDMIFRDLLQVRFASFQVFGGIVFLVIGIRYVLQGSSAIQTLRGEPEHLSGAIAMPFMIGPGTVSASVLAGAHLSRGASALAIAVAMTATLLGVLALKAMHDYVKKRHAQLVDRYIDIVGRASALVIGTIAVEMIFQGIDLWLKRRA